MQLIQVAQHAKDLDRAAQFYSRLLGAAPVARYDPPGLLFFELDGVRLLIERGAPSSVLYLGVPDVRETIDALRRDGVQVESEPQVIFHHEDDALGTAGTDEWQGFIRDSEDNLVGLVSMIG